MARISTRQQKAHDNALALLKGSSNLTHEQTLDFFRDYHEGAKNLNGLNGAFFTPHSLATDFAIEADISGEKKIIDLCAGIGMLSYACTANDRSNVDLTCVELNHDYASIGKSLVPWAKWITEDVTNINEEDNRQRFDIAISNPPFGNIGGISMFDLEVVRIASKIAKRGVFILPQQSTPFRYSGHQSFRSEVTDKLAKWMSETGIEFEFNMGIDCNTSINDWKGVKPVVEIVSCDFI